MRLLPLLCLIFLILTTLSCLSIFTVISLISLLFLVAFSDPSVVGMLWKSSFFANASAWSIREIYNNNCINIKIVLNLLLFEKWYNTLLYKCTILCNTYYIRYIFFITYYLHCYSLILVWSPSENYKFPSATKWRENVWRIHLLHI